MHPHAHAHTHTSVLSTTTQTMSPCRIIKLLENILLGSDLLGDVANIRSSVQRRSSSPSSHFHYSILWESTNQATEEEVSFLTGATTLSLVCRNSTVWLKCDVTCRRSVSFLLVHQSCTRSTCGPAFLCLKGNGGTVQWILCGPITMWPSPFRPHTLNHQGLADVTW